MPERAAGPCAAIGRVIEPALAGECDGALADFLGAQPPELPGIAVLGRGRCGPRFVSAQHPIASRLLFGVGRVTFRRYKKKLAKLQRRLAKKTKGSNRREKAKLKVARVHAKIADARRDFLHKLSTRLINENQVIAVESLSVSNMQKNRCLSKSIADASWSEFLRQLEYKARWYGRELIGIDRWYPSSKRCFDCGYTMPKMPLSVREWVCPECGSIHDRDINAARNVLAAGLAVSAHREAVSPVCM